MGTWVEFDSILGVLFHSLRVVFQIKYIFGLTYIIETVYFLKIVSKTSFLYNYFFNQTTIYYFRLVQFF